ncbi:OsmC/Ohr family protein [hydrothermal vent metagenome]|uniref:OsmC/Ohr family protein n=1 Tax=hydrothermal vent metagenome TaxID=652676 RepID=A0A3B0T7B3_9ZZZZ
MKTHTYEIKVEWMGNEGKGTLNYRSYNRNHSISANGKYDGILGSSDPSFLGDKSRYNPEDLFLSSLSSCHMLWYLHLCSVHKIIVTDYVDNATAVMEGTKNGSGRFKEVVLNPVVTIKNKELTEKANALHTEANKMCFIANSCNFEIAHNPKVVIASKTNNQEKI